MQHVADRYGLALSTSSAAAEAYNRGVGALLRVQEGGLPAISESITHDPTFALGHAGLALLGHEYCAAVDIDARLAAAGCTPTGAPSASAATCTPSSSTSAATPVR